jgi:hypothetical protein
MELNEGKLPVVVIRRLFHNLDWALTEKHFHNNLISQIKIFLTHFAYPHFGE